MEVDAQPADMLARGRVEQHEAAQVGETLKGEVVGGEEGLDAVGVCLTRGQQQREDCVRETVGKAGLRALERASRVQPPGWEARLRVLDFPFDPALTSEADLQLPLFGADAHEVPEYLQAHFCGEAEEGGRGGVGVHGDVFVDAEVETRGPGLQIRPDTCQSLSSGRGDAGGERVS